MREVYAFARAMAILLGKHAWPGFPVPGRRQPKHTVLQRVKHHTFMAQHEQAVLFLDDQEENYIQSKCRVTWPAGLQSQLYRASALLVCLAAASEHVPAPAAASSTSRSSGNGAVIDVEATTVEEQRLQANPRGKKKGEKFK